MYTPLQIDQMQSRLDHLRRACSTGRDSEIKRVPIISPSAVALINRRGRTPEPSVSRFTLPAGQGVESIDLFGLSSIDFLATPLLPALTKSHTVIEIADHFAHPDPSQIHMASYFKVQREKVRLESTLRGYFEGYTIETTKSPFGEDRFRPFDPSPYFEETHGFLRFIGR